jgi:hypothetical protein
MVGRLMVDGLEMNRFLLLLLLLLLLAARKPDLRSSWAQTSEQLGYGDPSNGEFKSLAVVPCFLRFLLFSPQKATKRTKKKGIGSARLEGPFGHFF